MIEGTLDLYGNPIPPNRAWMDGKVNELMEKAPHFTVQERIQLSEELTEEHFEKYGFHAESQALYRLVEFILFDELRSKHKKDSDILSEHQLLRRKEGIRVRKSLNRGREVPLSHASTIAINGMDYRRPIRIHRK